MSRRRPLLLVVCGATMAICVLAVARGYATRESASASAPVATASSGASGSGPASPIDVVDFAFAPDTFSVAVGSTVVWTNRDTATHSVRSSDGRFVEQTMKTGATATATLTTPGTYSYICGLHPFMTATITVA